MTGVMLRLVHFFRDHSIWFDEAAVMLNVLDKSYFQLLGPLDHCANGPPLFLWGERLLTTMVGDRPWVWRLPALVASIAVLPLFADVGRRWLPRWPALVALGLVAFSDRILWHAVEVRPYSGDLLIVVLILWLDTRLLSRSLTGRWVVWLVLFPIVLACSFPALFMVGPMILITLGETWKARDRRALLLGILTSVVCTMVVTLLAIGPIAAQRDGMLQGGYSWTAHMPDWNRPAHALAWPANALFEILRYAFRPIGGLLLPLAAAGALAFARAGEWRRLAVLLLPIGAVMLAGALHLYPCGGSRTTLFLAPILAILTARGAVALLPALPVVRLGTITLLAVIPAGAAWSAVFPWPCLDSRGAAAHVLGRRLPDDPVVIRLWDEIYFFRELPDHCRRPFDAIDTAQDERLWVIHHLKHDVGPVDPLRRPDQWRVAEEREFDGARVYLLIRRTGPTALARTP